MSESESIVCSAHGETPATFMCRHVATGAACGLTTPNWPADETDGWEMASLAGYILGAEGVYRPPFDHLRWFMLLSNLRHAN
jgi:Family of unknown function (DUF6882)